MGRHRRIAAAPAAEESADGAAGRRREAGRRKRSAIPVRTGLIGISAAVAVGAVAVASGLLPGGDSHTVGGGPTVDQVRSQAAPDLLTQGGATTEPTDRSSASAKASRGTDRSAGPAKSRSTKSGTPSESATASRSASASASASPSASASSSSASPSKSATPTKTAAGKKAAAKKQESARPSSSTSKAPATTAAGSKAPAAPAAPKPSSSAPAPSRSSTPTATPSSAEAAVLALVNQERAKVGCSPVTASASLASLAQNFSDDMAERGFFGHTDPDGKTPWDRADAAGVSGLGGENIARGQADAQAVMDAWMNSDGHRANILNCDYKTLGVGVHLGAGGPWWTQDFGF
ncbi:CAP domain-containing protein [Streptomyces sp. NPDC057509]|uniref:CAP domain-containing protein n=1 Tax=Streptomyces sp. NPDC057509 TaxID=3346152 RepID=UPI0036C38BB3